MFKDILLSIKNAAILVLGEVIIFGVPSLLASKSASILNTLILLLILAALFGYSLYIVPSAIVTMSNKKRFVKIVTTLLFCLAIGFGSYYGQILFKSNDVVGGHVALMIPHIPFLLIGVPITTSKYENFNSKNDETATYNKSNRQTTWVENLKTGKLDRYDTYTDGNTSYVSKNGGETHYNVHEHKSSNSKTIIKY